jgi:plasmid stabilization system protein ParE
MKIVISTAALGDLVAVREWLFQPGSGPHAHRKQMAISQAIARLGEEATLWPLHLAAFDPRTRKRSVAGHVILYRILSTTQVEPVEYVFVDAVFGPGRFQG